MSTTIVNAAQNALLVARAMLAAANAAEVAARAAHPEAAREAEFSARYDAAERLDDDGAAAEAVLDEWQRDGVSDRVVAGVADELRAVKAAAASLVEAERALFGACLRGLALHGPIPGDVRKMLDAAAKGESLPGLYRGTPDRPGNYDKLVGFCMDWSGK